MLQLSLKHRLAPVHNASDGFLLVPHSVGESQTLGAVKWQKPGFNRKSVLRKLETPITFTVEPWFPLSMLFMPVLDIFIHLECLNHSKSNPDAQKQGLWLDPLPALSWMLHLRRANKNDFLKSVMDRQKWGSWKWEPLFNLHSILHLPDCWPATRIGLGLSLASSQVARQLVAKCSKDNFPFYLNSPVNQNPETVVDWIMTLQVHM
jgi:hypothetical protein